MLLVASEAPAPTSPPTASPPEFALRFALSVAWTRISAAEVTTAPSLINASVVLFVSLTVAVPTPPIRPATESPKPTASTSGADDAEMSTFPVVVVTVPPPIPAVTVPLIVLEAYEPPTPTKPPAAKPPESVSSVELSRASSTTLGALIVPPVRMEASVVLLASLSVTVAKPPTSPAMEKPKARASTS